MKTLILIRHAKSSWGEAGVLDSERPLNDRGKKDAPEMAKRLKKKDLKIDAIVSSPAKRARKTAKYFAEEFKIDKDEIIIEEDLYGADIPGFRKVVEGLKDKYDMVALFSHNPGITDYANILANVSIDTMPTCSVFAVQSNVNSWQEFNLGEKSFLFFDYPRNPMAEQ